MASTMQYKRVQLSGYSDEFKEVEKLFKNSSSKGGHYGTDQSESRI